MSNTPPTSAAGPQAPRSDTQAQATQQTFDADQEVPAGDDFYDDDPFSFDDNDNVGAQIFHHSRNRIADDDEEWLSFDRTDDSTAGFEHRVGAAAGPSHVQESRMPVDGNGDQAVSDEQIADFWEHHIQDPEAQGNIANTGVGVPGSPALGYDGEAGETFNPAYLYADPTQPSSTGLGIYTDNPVFPQQQPEASRQYSQDGGEPQESYTNPQDYADPLDRLNTSGEQNESTPASVNAADPVGKDGRLKCQGNQTACNRGGVRIFWQYGGRAFCERHRKAWERKYGSRVRWPFQRWSIDQAVAAIRPDVVPPVQYRNHDHQDQTLIYHRTRAVEWTQRFLNAVQTPVEPVTDGEPTPPPLLNHQKTLDERSKLRWSDSYHQNMVNARITLLFYIALRFHEGGPAVYCTGGSNSGYKDETGHTFLERLQRIEEVLKEDKRVAIDVIEGKGVEAFVRGPVGYHGRKKTNDNGNAARGQTKKKLKTAEDAKDDASLVVESEDQTPGFETAVQGRGRSKSVASSAPTRPRKRKRGDNAGRDAENTGTAKAVASAGPRKKRPTRKRAAPGTRQDLEDTGSFEPMGAEGGGFGFDNQPFLPPTTGPYHTDLTGWPSHAAPPHAFLGPTEVQTPYWHPDQSVDQSHLARLPQPTEQNQHQRAHERSFSGQLTSAYNPELPPPRPVASQYQNPSNFAQSSVSQIEPPAPNYTQAHNTGMAVGHGLWIEGMWYRDEQDYYRSANARYVQR